MPTRPLSDRFMVAFSFAGEQRDLVRSIAEALEVELGKGAVFLDEWYEHYLAGEDADLKLQSIYGERCALAVVCISQDYGSKPWTQAEHSAIRARITKARASAEERDRLSILPIRVGHGEVQGVHFNTIAPDVRARSVSETASLILDRLSLLEPNVPNQSAEQVDASGWPRSPPKLVWPMANHSGEREAFATLLTTAPPWRLLPIQGASETGKSHITRQMLANALAIRAIACGRFDFKGTTDMDGEVSAFIQELHVPLPPPSARLHERLAHVLAELRQRAGPTLLIFDTYESVGEAREWVEKQLLPCLIRATWLRVVIAGQQVPDPTVSVWSAVARPILHLQPPPAADWYAYGKQHKPGVTMDDVETACRLAEHKASMLSQMLGPKR